MKNYDIDKIRNIILLGHGGSGKTTITESLLNVAGITKRMGSVETGNTVSDFEKEEIHRGFSINTSVIPIEYGENKYNILDTPGHLDFKGEISAALRVAGGAVLVVDATSGVEVGTEKANKILEENKVPRIIFINKMDKGFVQYNKIVEELKSKFGKKVAPFCIPIGEKDTFKGFVNVVDLKGRIYDGKSCVDTEVPEDVDITPIRDMLLEAVAETDDNLMEKFFNGEEFTTEEIHNGLHKGIVSGEIIPVLLGSATNSIGIHTLFNMFLDYMPTPNEMQDGERVGEDPKTLDLKVRKVATEEVFSAIVFKTIVDPFVGRISLFKVNSGVLRKDMEVLNANKGKKEKISNLFFLRGITQIDSDEIRAGDIGGTTKLQYTQTGDTICDSKDPIVYPAIDFPDPCLYLAVEPLNKSDDEKISILLQKLTDEDPTFRVERNYETKQLLIGGQGEKHLKVITHKLENKFGVNSVISDLKVSYRETIKEMVEVQGKHKKQTGGSGQYGDVHIRFEPSTKKFEFIDKVKGGTVPKQYIPAVEKGIVEASQHGVLAGYPLINFKATLLDGSYHSVDSNELSFKLAGILAYKLGVPEAKPVILEPIMKMEVLVPEDYLGDVIGDLNKRRGKILGIVPQGELQQIEIEVPQMEVLKYAIDLRAITQARGEFKLEFKDFEELPERISQKIIENNQK
jgi:elongation factor G